MARHKLSAGEKELVMLWYAQCFSASEVQKFLKQHLNISISLQDAHYYLQRYSAEIAIERKKFLDTAFHIPEANPVIRVHRLSILARKAFDENTKDYISLIEQIRAEVKFIAEFSPFILPDMRGKKQLSEEDLQEIVKALKSLEMVQKAASGLHKTEPETAQN